MTKARNIQNHFKFPLKMEGKRLQELWLAHGVKLPNEEMSRPLTTSSSSFSNRSNNNSNYYQRLSISRAKHKHCCRMKDFYHCHFSFSFLSLPRFARAWIRVFFFAFLLLSLLCLLQTVFFPKHYFSARSYQMNVISFFPSHFPTQIFLTLAAVSSRIDGWF